MYKIVRAIRILSFLFIIGMYGCYEDLGNYDYTDIPKTELKGLQEKYSVYALVDVLRIPIEVTPADREYEYTWYVFKANSSENDTLGTTKDLEYRVELLPENYTLAYEVKDKKTGIATIQTAELSVQTALTSGWYVLKSENGKTDVDVFSDLGKAEDVIASNNDGMKLEGNARDLAFFMTYAVPKEDGAGYMNKPVMFALTDKDACVIRTSSGDVVNDFDNLFYDVPQRAPQACFGNGQGIYLVNGGGLYSIYAMSSNTGKFGLPKLGDHRLSEHAIFVTGTGVTPVPLFFDEISSSFCTGNSFGDELVSLSNTPIAGLAKPVPSVNNMGADLLYLDRDKLGRIYALVKKGEHNLMLRMLAYYVNRRTNNPVYQCDTLNADSPLLTADYRAMNRSNTIIYFSKGNTIYSCNMDNNYEVREQDIIPEGEEITWMEQVSFEYNYLPNTRFNHLCVATYKAGKYKLYYYNLQAGNLVKNPEFVEGQGRVGAVRYVLQELYQPN